MKGYQIGQVVELRGRFNAGAEDPPVYDDPTSVTLQVRSPSGVLETRVYPPDDDLIVREEPGVYRYDLKVTEAGQWRYRWVAEGNFDTARERTFHVVRSSFV